MSQPIIGGYLDTTTKGVVALAFKGHDQVAVFCSGSLLAPNLVLTAHHCIAQIGDGSSEEVHCDSSQFTAKYDPRQIFVSTDSQPQVTSQFYAVKEIREAPGSTNVCGYDVALLILSGAGVPASAATPIEPVLDSPTVAQTTFSAVGFGLRDPNDNAGTTAGTRQRFDSSSVYCVGALCPTAAGTSADEFVGNSPVCSGDSGGPALVGGRVFGVTSRGDSACTYALYSNVADWKDFVRSTAVDAAASGAYAPLPWVTSSGGTTQPSAGAGTSAGGNSGGVSVGHAGSTSASGGASASGGTSSGNAAGSDAGGATSDIPPPSTTLTPTVDPLGAACASATDCLGNYQCWSASAAPPGICVPKCGASTSCPTRYSCNESLSVCTPAQATVAKGSIVASSSCAFTAQPHTGSGAFAAALVAGLAWLGRRRRNAA